MSPTANSFANAVYTRHEIYDFSATIFSRRELKVLLMINGRRSVSHIARMLGTGQATLKPVFARLVRLGLIQTEETLVSTDEADLFFERQEEPPAKPLFRRQPLHFA